MTRSLGSFGRTTAPSPRSMTADDAIALVRRGGACRDMLLPYGNGRSYGDSCQIQNGVLVDMRPRAKVLKLDAAGATIEAEAGILLSEVIAEIAPHGLFLPVVPGTQLATLGGAIANDIHGKNHHRRGSFGCHVDELQLLRSDGQVHTCSATANARLFFATIGGMGLTGIILSARIRLMRVPSLDVIETVAPFASIDDYLDRAPEAEANNEYAVAWIDQLAGGRRAGRGLLMAGNHAEGGARTADPSAPRFSVPVQPPFSVLNGPFLRAFNWAYRSSRSRAGGPKVTGYRSFFFPLDGVADWNRLYGPKGLFQHQSVVPYEAARETLPRLLEATRKAGQASFLTVLKRFGVVRSPGMLSFARPGYTLTLDFPNRGEGTLALLKELDAITIDAGGGVNPYKDARMSAATFAATFPDWQRLELMRDPAFVSSFWARTALRLKAREMPTLRAAE